MNLTPAPLRVGGGHFNLSLLMDFKPLPVAGRGLPEGLNYFRRTRFIYKENS
ncbi:MAG: hypothetical protein RLZZ203_2025 [Cyanobacteriota bacterium]|jgi:hypothetical protein